MLTILDGRGCSSPQSGVATTTSRSYSSLRAGVVVVPEPAPLATGVDVVVDVGEGKAEVVSPSSSVTLPPDRAMSPAPLLSSTPPPLFSSFPRYSHRLSHPVSLLPLPLPDPEPFLLVAPFDDFLRVRLRLALRSFSLCPIPKAAAAAFWP